MLVRTMIFVVCISLVACDQARFETPGEQKTKEMKNYGDFGVNDHFVYCGRQLIQGADGIQFNYLGSQYINYEDLSYAKDSIHVYTCDVREPSFFSPAKPHQTIFKILEGADPATFVLLENGYVKDDKTVYYGNEKLVGADAGKFRIIKNDVVVYAFDGKHVYHDYQKLPVKDPENFRLLGGLFATDNHHVYANRTRIAIHPRKAEVLTYRLIRDSKNVYYMNKQIKGADACSFAPGGEFEDSLDVNHFYYQEMQSDLNEKSERNRLKIRAHTMWKNYYVEFRKANKTGCPKKRVLIPRHEGKIEIIDIKESIL